MKANWQNRRVAYSLLGVVIVVFAFVVLRTYFFNRTIDKVKNKLENQYQLKLSMGESHFVGLSKLAINNILVKVAKGDTVFFIDSLYLQIRVFDLLKGNVRFNKIYAHRLEGTIKEASIETAIEYKKTTSVIDKKVGSQNYALTLGRFAKSVFSLFPSEILINSTRIIYQGEKGEIAIQCPTFSLKNHQIKGNVQFVSNGNIPAECLLQGQLDENQQSIFIELKPFQTNNVNILVFENIWGLGIRFDSLSFGYKVLSSNSELFKCSGYLNTFRLSMNHEKLAPNPVIFDKAGIQFNATIGKKSIEIDSSSVVTCNQISFSPYLCYRNTSHRELELKIIEKEFESSTLFQSFPEGLFTNIRDIKTKGNLDYAFNFKVFLDNPDSIWLESNLKSKNLYIEKFGTTNLTQLNDTFTYEVFKNNQWVRSIFVGPENPNYSSLNNIASSLQYSVLTTEDGGFFYHKGFDLESIKKSISDDLKKGRFARGGSTITMQLVKNVYLSKNKTISRKLEELLMVWMIENLNLTTKERMFEVYLNIIEWGPGIYGIMEASDFYFHKKPSELNLSESIYLASIVPSPENFRFTFNKEVHLRDYYREYYRFASETMLSRGWIVADDTIGLVPDVVLKGEAKNFLNKTDSL